MIISMLNNELSIIITVKIIKIYIWIIAVLYKSLIPLYF